MHALSASRPVCVWYLPSAHAVHELWPGWVWYRPVPQSGHDVCDTSFSPARQLVQEAWPALEMDPVGQLGHVLWPPLPCHCPAGQFLHELSYFWPVCVWYLPAPQPLQLFL